LHTCKVESDRNAFLHILQGQKWLRSLIGQKNRFKSRVRVRILELWNTDRIQSPIGDPGNSNTLADR